MSGDETPEDRLEKALERIARAADLPPPVSVHPATEAAAERLDRMIATLRDALGK